MMELRWYQKEAVDAAWNALHEKKNPLIVLPTGSGKSLVIAELAKRAAGHGGKTIVLAHRKELLVQDQQKVHAIAPEIETGIYSAGLRSRDTHQEVVFAGIQSAYQKAHEFGARVLTIIDEAHLVPHSDDGMYRQWIDEITEINSAFHQVVGLTATPFRTDSGALIDGDVFDEVCYEAPLDRLMDEGYLCRLKNAGDLTEVDSSGLSVRGGEYVPGDAEQAFMEIVGDTINELIEFTKGRKSIAIFCSSINHAKVVCEMLEEKTGETVGEIHSQIVDLERSTTLELFAEGKLRWIVNCNVLTTGWDCPRIDAIGVLRATMSAGLFAQICGRGLRLFEGKEDCLILDFGQNILRHGPLDSAEYGKKILVSSGNGGDERGEEGEAEETDGEPKLCVKCEHPMPQKMLRCPACGALQPFELRHDVNPDQESSILGAKEPNTYEVLGFELSHHVSKKSGNHSMRVDYDVGGIWPQSEWVCLEHAPGSFPRRKAVEWWEAHSRCSAPSSIQMGIDLWRNGALRVPRTITVQEIKGFKSVVDREFETDRPTEWFEAATSDDPFEFEDIPF